MDDEEQRMGRARRTQSLRSPTFSFLNSPAYLPLKNALAVR